MSKNINLVNKNPYGAIFTIAIFAVANFLTLKNILQALVYKQIER